jgi:hypothetical protein
VGVFSPAFDRHCAPLHTATFASVVRVAERAGDSVRHSVWVIPEAPRWSSISQLMLPEGERNSVTVGVCGTSVPVVAVVVDVVPVRAVVVVLTEVVVVVLDAAVEVDGDALGLVVVFEHAATSAPSVTRDSTATPDSKTAWTRRSGGTRAA